MTTTQIVTTHCQQPTLVLRTLNPAPLGEFSPIEYRCDDIKNRALRVRSTLVAIKVLIEIRENSLGSDPLSLRIVKWLDKMSSFVRHILIPSTKTYDGSLIRALEEMDVRVKKLVKKLVNPMGDSLLDNPLIEGEFVWSERVQRLCQSYKPLSPYTDRAFDVKPHELARAIIAWGQQFYPTLFEIKADERPMDETRYELIKINAKLIAAVHRSRKMTSQPLKPSNLELLLERNLRVERQIRQTGVQEVKRLNQILQEQKADAEERFKILEGRIDNERQQRFELMNRLIELQVRMPMLEGRIQSLENDNISLRNMLNSCQQQLNEMENGDSGCSIM